MRNSSVTFLNEATRWDSEVDAGHAPMLLDNFTLTLRSHPEFPSVSPFKGWDEPCTTKTFGWYEAYNQTNHNREECLGLATLEQAVSAVVDASSIRVDDLIRGSLGRQCLKLCPPHAFSAWPQK